MKISALLYYFTIVAGNFLPQMGYIEVLVKGNAHGGDETV